MGTDPGAALRDLHGRILDTDPAPAPTSPAIAPTQPAIGGGTPAKAGVPVPRQLPAPPRWFTGRAAELARLDRASTAAPETSPQHADDFDDVGFGGAGWQTQQRSVHSGRCHGGGDPSW